jgi:hypothetical protein
MSPTATVLSSSTNSAVAPCSTFGQLIVSDRRLGLPCPSQLRITLQLCLDDLQLNHLELVERVKLRPAQSYALNLQFLKRRLGFVLGHELMLITLTQHLLISADHVVTRGAVDKRVLRRGPLTPGSLGSTLWHSRSFLLPARLGDQAHAKVFFWAADEFDTCRL